MVRLVAGLGQAYDPGMDLNHRAAILGATIASVALFMLSLWGLA